MTAAILGLLIIVYCSYRQTIDACPNAGGSYTVASELSAEAVAVAAMIVIRNVRLVLARFVMRK